MNKTNLLSLVVLASLAVACDPYEDVKSGTPTLMSATAADLANHVAYTANAAGGSVTIDITCASVAETLCAGIDPTDVDADQLSDLTDLTEVAVFITFDRQIDGGVVQTGLSNCLPTGGWLTVTPAAPAAGEGWYSCYSPSSPTPDEGGSVVVFAAATPVDPATIAGWDEYTPFPAAPAPITMSGTVAGQAVTVTVNRVDVTTCDTATLCQ